MRQTPPPARPPIAPARRTALVTAACTVAAGLLGAANTTEAQWQPPSTGDRVLGLDVSAWQGNLSQGQWDGFYAQARKFVFIRSSRGGTTGYYNQSDSDNSDGLNRLSQRYDDPYFVQNITRATNAGMLAGPYHFGRMDIIATTKNAQGIPNNGTDEADHFIQMAGAWMRPGYLLPVFDLESGSGARSGQDLAQFAIDFSDRIHEVKGIRPTIYIGSNYVSAIGNTAALAQTYPNLWMPRYVNQADPNAIPVQTAQIDNYSSVNYGAWKTSANPQPWKVWQYASTGRLSGYGGDLDLNVAQGNIEFVKDMQTPAVWIKGTSGDWSTITNWNSGEAPVPPVQGEGQVPRAGALVLPGVRGPGSEDNVELNRAGENVTVTHATGAHAVRRLTLHERLAVTGGSLNVRRTGTAGTGGTLALSGGTTTIDQAQFNTGSALEFGGAGTLTVGSLVLNTGVSYTGAAGTGLLNGKAGGASPAINLGGGTRTFNVANGSSDIDLRVALPLANGGLTKSGAGALELTGNNAGYTGALTVTNGHLVLTGPNQIGTAGARTTQTSTTVGGTVRLDGNGLNYAVPITTGGLGFNNTAALENVSGINTWSGPVNLAGTEANQNFVGLNQIGAAAGSTLNLTGVIQNSGTGLRSWAKTGAGDVVLGGASPNTYNHLTRVFGGRLVVEKNGALGAAGSSTSGDGNTFQLPGVGSTIAFRAPAGAAGLNYAAVEWIHTEGTGVNGLGQVDSLGGDNVFAGHLGLGGPSVGGVQQASIGVALGSLEVKGGLYARSVVGPEARNITKLGGGTLVLSGDSGPAPTNSADRSLVNSTFNLNAGTVVLQGTSANSANVPGVRTWNVNDGTRLSLGRTGAAGAAATVALNGGTLHTSAAAVNVAGPVTAPAAGNGGAIDTQGAGASITVAGAFSIGAGRMLAKAGGGTLNITGVQSHGAGATLFARTGTTNVHTDAGGGGGGGGAGGVLAVSVGVDPFGGGSAVVNFHSPQHLAGLTIASGSRATIAPGGGNTLRTAGLTLNTGTLDHNDNDLIVDYATAEPSPYERLANAVVHGFLHRRNGIVSTAGASTGADRILAVFDNAAVNLSAWGAELIDPTTVVGQFTFFGDTNLDGQVTAADYDALDANAGRAADGRWNLGDFTFDGRVSLFDYAAIDANLGKGTANPGALEAYRQAKISQHTAIYGGDYALALNEAEAGNFPYLFQAHLPDPATATAVLAFSALLAARRRRA